MKINRITRLLVCCLVVGITSFFATVQHASAQSSTQVNIIGIPPVLSSPFADDIQNNFTNGRYQVVFNYSSFTNRPVDFVFDFVLKKDNRTIVEVASLPKAFTPGNYVFSNFFQEIQFSESAGNVINKLDRNLRNQVIQSGAVPEGRYTIQIEARPQNRQTGISPVPGITPFTVQYPPPPILVTVPDEANVMVSTPTFSWTPVVNSTGNMFEYEFLLVEVMDNQNPLQAINSNRALALETVVGNTLAYTSQFLPLKEGREYAWRIKAKDQSGELPMQNDGESEIYTFTYRDKSASDFASENIRALEKISIVPGFAELSGFRRLTIDERPASYLLNGPAQLSLNFMDIGEVTFTANLRGVQIQKNNLQNPILMGGRIETSAKGLERLTGPLSDNVEINGIVWEFGSGLTAEMSIKTPDDALVKTRGNMMLQPSGLRGVVKAEGAPLASFGKAPLQIDILELSARFPESEIRAITETRFLDNPVCGTSDSGIHNDSFRIRLDCDTEKTIPIAGSSDNLVLNLKEITGQAIGSWGEKKVDYSASVLTDINLKLADERSCGVSAALLLSSEEGFSTEKITPTCSIPNPAIDLGFLHATINNLEFNEIGLNETGDGFDFDINFDTQLYFPASPDVSLPEMENINISNKGITFPEVEFDREQLPVNTTFTIGDFDLDLQRFELDNFIFPWFEWDDEGPGPWSFSFDAGLNLPFSASLPGCFSDTELEIQNASVAGDGSGDTAVRGSFSASDIASCSWDIGPGFTLDIHEFEGQVAMTRLNDDFTLQSDFVVDADLNAGSPFACGTDPVIDLDEFTLSLSEGINGELRGLNPTCPIEIGPYTAEITDGSLLFEHNAEMGQQAFLDAAASLQLSEDQTASGSFRLDLTTGGLEDVEFQIDGPFQWGIPKEDPVLVFTIDEAMLSDEGLYIDGRQTLTVGEEEIGTTFDGLLINWDTYDILDGRIIIDHGFNFLAGIDTDEKKLQFSTATQDSTLDLSPGVFMELAGTVQIDSLGLHTSGSASAQIHYEDLELGDLEVEYSEDFAMGLEPLGITRGQADFYWNSNRVAYGDNSGFHPDLSFFAKEFLPERIPLPTQEVAYLQIRDEEEEELVVNTTRQDDGTFLIETIEGQSLDLVLPVLQRDDEAAPPRVQVELEELVVNPSNGSYISGAVYATVTGENPLSDRPNLPVELEDIFFTKGVNGAGQQIEALFLSGRLKLFEQTLGEEQFVNLYVQSDGLARGGFAFSDADVQIPLDGPGGRVVLAADSLAGSFEWNPQSPSLSDFGIDIQGGFQVNSHDGSPIVKSDLAFTYNQYGISINNFSPGNLLEEVPSLDLGFINIEIPEIKGLNLSYHETTGFDYYADLDFMFEVNIDGQTIPFPLKNVEIRSDLGFVIPSQDIHDGSVPDLDLPPIDFGVFNIKPLAFRMQRDTLNWNEWSPGDLLDMIPNIDFELSFPQFEESVPSLSQLSLTVSDASFAEGLLEGNLLPLDLAETPVFFPLGSGAGINISQIGGSLFSDDDGQQFSINLDGEFEMSEFFSGGDGECPAPGASVNLTRSGTIEGTISEFTPCGNIAVGPIELAFGESQIDFAVDEDNQTATLSGNAQALLHTENGLDIEANGDLEFDLLNGQITDGNIQINSEFTWHYPSADSLFEFQVESASLSPEGLVFNAGGSIQLGEGSAAVDFQNMTFDLTTGELVDGSADIINEFGFDVSFGPTSWALIDPATEPDFSQGVRMTVPGNVTIDGTGITVGGTGGASLYFGEESYDQLQVEFEETRFTFDNGARISEGRADFMLQEEDEDPIRLAWYDSDGFHPDNIAAAVPLPDTLALPSKDVAYIVLRDEQGNNLVQSEGTGDGLSISTTDPLQLVLPALQNANGQPQSVSVEFDDIVINAALEMVSGSITANLEDSPLNLTESTDFPLGLTALQYVRENGENYMYADAQLVLPGSLSDVDIEIGQIALGPDGFSDVTISVGEYAEQYDAENEQIVVSEEFADGAFGITVRGAEVTFGSEPSYKFSGDITSNLLRDEEEEMAAIHIAADYSEANWNFLVDAEHLVPQKFPIGSAELILEELEADVSDGNFAVLIDGRFKLPDVVGDELEIGIQGLRIGTEGVEIDQINTEAFAGQTLSLFGQQDNITIESLGLELTAEYHLIAEINGLLNFLDRDFIISGLRMGSDGTFELGEGGVNLLGEEPVELMSENLVLTTLELGVSDGTAQLTALADLTLPDPVETESEIGISINHLGEVNIQQPEINFEGISKDIPGIGVISLTDAGVEINDFHQLDFAIYAMAEVDFEGVTGSIEFGQAGSAENWGLRYQYGGAFEWRITNAPEFTFSNEMFHFDIKAAQAADLDNGVFGINLGVDAGLTLDGIEGSIAFSDMIISANGLEDLGTFQNADLDLGPASLSLSTFEFSKNGGTLVLEQEAEGASEGNPETEEVEIETLQYLSFGGSMTLPGFSGGIEQVLYYKTETNVFLSVKNLNVEFNEMASLTATIEYESYETAGDFSLKVAGSASFTPPEGGTEIGLSALGRMEHINNNFSFGIFVKVDADVPVIPGIITMTSFGGGFFYNATGDDFDDVLALSGYELTNPVAPWEEEDDGYDFAIIAFAGVGIIGEQGVYTINGEAILMLTPDWIALDVSAEVFDGEAAINAGMYLAVKWKTGFRMDGGVTATVDNAIMYGIIDMHFQVVRNGSDTQWALNGGIEGLDILSVFQADATVIAGPDGFYFDVAISYGFDVSIISARADLEGAVWWIRGQQFGSYVEFGVEISLFKGLFTGGGNFKGALLVESGDYLIYATASVYVDILIFTGHTSAWVSVENGSVSGGRGGSDRYEDMIADARAEAQQMNEQMDDALNAAQNFEPLPNMLYISEDAIAEAGEAILSSPNLIRTFVFGAMLLHEKDLTGTNPELFQNIFDTMKEIEDLPKKSDYSINTLRTDMNTDIEELADVAGGIYNDLSSIRSSAIEWRGFAEESLDQILQSPVQSLQMEWIGDTAPGFSIDEGINSANQDGLDEFRSDVELLDEQFKAAIDSIYSNIQKLDIALSPQGSNINGISEKFAESIASIDRYYANMGAFYWDINRWAEQSLGVYEDIDFDMEEAVINTAEGMLAAEGVDFKYDGTSSTLNTSNFSGVNFNALTNIAANRSAIIHLFLEDGNGYNSHLASEKSTFNNFRQNSDYLSYFSNFVLRATEFWYQMPVMGYESLSENSILKAEQVYETYENGLSEVKNAHTIYTNAIDDVYSIKHSIYATLEEVLRQYINWYEDLYGIGAAAEYASMLDDAQTTSIPPSITSISTSPSRDGFVNEFDIHWNSTHPNGDVVENSYYISDESGSGIFDETFMSVGTNTSAKRYLFKRNSGESYRNLSIRVRSRGPSGISIRKLRNASASLNRPQPSSGTPLLTYTYGGALLGVITYQDPEPPETPTISFPYFEDEYEISRSYGGLDFTIPMVRYWSNSANSLEFTAYSFDDVNDISGFEFTIGTSPGDSTLLGWTQQTGIPVNGSAANEQTYTVQGLSLTEGEEYYVTVRAINGAGVKSEAATHGPISIDTSPPSAPSQHSNSITEASFSKGSATYNQAISGNSYSWESPPYQSAATPFVTLRWNPSEDTGSGLYRYQIVASTLSDPDLAFSQGDITYVPATHRIRQISGGDLNFEDEYYIYIRAEDKAGSVSEALTLNPGKINDPSSPTTPEITAKASQGTVGFYLNRPAADAETGVEGYVYRFLRTDNWSNVGGENAITISNTGSSYKPAFISLPTSNLPEGIPLEIQVVAVNGQGRSSGIARSGEIILDTSPPQEPEVTVQQSGNYLDINVSDIYDPESGVSSVRYRLVSDQGDVQSWRNVTNISGVNKSPFSAYKSHYLGDTNIYNVNVEVQIRNGNGMGTTVSVTPVAEFIYPYLQQVEQFPVETQLLIGW